jgi:hypothetical protein
MDLPDGETANSVEDIWPKKAPRAMTEQDDGDGFTAHEFLDAAHAGQSQAAR